MKTTISHRGNEDGFALVASLVVVFALALVFAPLARYACLRSRDARTMMERAIEGVKERNADVAGKYEFD